MSKEALRLTLFPLSLYSFPSWRARVSGLAAPWMKEEIRMPRPIEPPIVLVKWYDLTKWLLARVESFPKNQRFVFGQRLTDRTLGVLETLVEASYSPAGRHKAELLARANRDLEVLRWLLRLAKERTLLTPRQYRFVCLALEECGRMLGGGGRSRSVGPAPAPGPPARITPLPPPQGPPTPAPRLMHRHKQLYDRVASFDNVLAAAREALRGKRGRAPGATFFSNLEHEVAALHRELRDGSYRPGPYHYFQIHDPKTRTVAAADFRDRVVHHAIVRVLEPLFEGRFIEDTYACRKRRGNHAAMRRAAAFARRSAFVLKCDVSSFFPSIDHEILMTQVARVVGDRRLLALLRQIITSHADGESVEWLGDGLFDIRVHRFGLPIGNLTSQFLSNVYLSPLDHFVKHELRIKGYVRYMDDFLLFDDDRSRLRARGRAVIEKLGELRLKMHPDKYRLRPTRIGVDFVGFVVFADGRIHVRRASVRRFERRYRRQRWQVEHQDADVDALMTSVRSWIAHVQHARSLNLRRAVLGRH